MIGTLFGHYRILERLGAGGMGEVYLAHDDRLDRDVAIKLLPTVSFKDDTARARLLREARSAAALNHPAICTIHEVGESEGHAYIAMEFVAGRLLSERVKQGALPLADVLSCGTQIAEALAHAHSRQIVHRDLKSANVIVTADGLIKVLDFGLAKKMPGYEVHEVTTSAHLALSEPGSVAGTLAYMSPEQLRGDAADARSDLWSLGVVLYELATGARPFKGHSSFELSSSILNEPPLAFPSTVPVTLRALG
jgi:serine/threonine protein kinase